MSACGNISAAQAQNCDQPLQAGTEDTMILFNRSAILSTTRDGSDNEIITAITLASGAVGYTYEGQNSSNAPKASMVKVGVFRKWSHEINFLALGADSVTKEQMQKMKDGDLCAIIYNKYKGVAGETAFEFYGFDSGLKAEAIERDVNNADSQGAFVIQLMSDQETGLEPHLPKTIYDTDYATTLAMIEGLL